MLPLLHFLYFFKVAFLHVLQPHAPQKTFSDNLTRHSFAFAPAVIIHDDLLVLEEGHVVISHRHAGHSYRASGASVFDITKDGDALVVAIGLAVRAHVPTPWYFGSVMRGHEIGQYLAAISQYEHRMLLYIVNVLF